MNNHYTNLEWYTAYENNKHARDMGLNNVSKSNSKRWDDDEFRKRTAKNISKGSLKSGSNKGNRNPRFRYKITDKNDKNYTRIELASLLKRSQSYTDALIDRAANGDVHSLFTQYDITVTDLKS